MRQLFLCLFIFTSITAHASDHFIFKNYAGQFLHPSNHLLTFQDYVGDKYFLTEPSNNDNIFIYYIENNQKYYLKQVKSNQVISDTIKETVFYMEKAGIGRYYLKNKDGLYISADSSGKVFLQNNNPFFYLGAYKIELKNKWGNYFKPSVFTWFIAGSVFWILLLFLFFFEPIRIPKYTSIIVMVLCNFCYGMFYISLDNYLNMWDEQFHAVVGKNLSDNPLKPLLFKNEMLLKEHNWTNTTIWLHKQPLFLYQIALGIKIFSNNFFGLRFHLLIINILMSILLFQISKIVSNKTTSYIFCLLFPMFYIKNELLTGHMATEHNDLSFAFYVVLSFWAFFEYTQKRSVKWAIIVGIAAGLAILNKWLTGFLVYIPLGLHWISYRFELKYLKHILISLFTTILTFLPWQIHAYLLDPKTYMDEMNYNRRHLFEVIEGHQEEFTYYFDKWPIYYGFPFWAMIIVFLIYYMDRKNINLNMRYSLYLIISITVTYLIFTLAATKMLCYVFPVSFFVLLFISEAIRLAFSKKHTLIISVIFYALYLLKYDTIHETHSFWKRNESLLFYTLNTGRYSYLNQEIKHPHSVLFGTNEFYTAAPLFFCDNLDAAYSFTPSEQDLSYFKSNKTNVYVLYNKQLPEYMKKQNFVNILPDN